MELPGPARRLPRNLARSAGHAARVIRLDRQRLGQNQGYEMGQAVLASHPEVGEIRLRLPNVHHLEFGLDPLRASTTAAWSTNPPTSPSATSPSRCGERRMTEDGRLTSETRRWKRGEWLAPKVRKRRIEQRWEFASPLPAAPQRVPSPSGGRRIAASPSERFAPRRAVGGREHPLARPGRPREAGSFPEVRCLGIDFRLPTSRWRRGGPRGCAGTIGCEARRRSGRSGR